MAWAVAVVGTLAQVVAWRLVARDRVPFWPATIGVFAVLGVASILVGEPSCCRDVPAATAVGVGAASGLLLRAPPAWSSARRRATPPRGSRPRDLPSTGRGPVRDRARPHARGRRPRRGALLAGLVLDELTAETSVAVRDRGVGAAVVVSVAWGAWRSSPARSAAPCGPASRSGRAARITDRQPPRLDGADARVASARGPWEGAPMSFLSTAVQSVLTQGEYCHVATSSRAARTARRSCSPTRVGGSGSRRRDGR